MRKKRNKINITVNTAGYIKRYFGVNIGRILVPNDRSLQNCEMPYVKHEEAENVLNDFLIRDIYKDKSIVFTGLTGSGKTTILHHVFGIERKTNSPYINDKKIIIPIDFNRSQKTAQVAVLSTMRVAVLSICRKYGIEFPDKDNKEFYDYIKEKREDFLEINPKHGRATDYVDKMTTFLEKMPTTFASCQLQYVMDCPKCDLELAILIVDNVEGFMVPDARAPKERYLAPVIEAFKLGDCIGQRISATTWSFNMVIACRHHIWRIMKGEFSDNSPENALLQSYVTTEIPYDLANPVKVNDIIKKREDVFAQKQREPDKWEAATNVVDTIMQTMENTIGEFVLQIELKDLRKSMAKIQELILHRGLQKVSDEKIEGAFQIDSIEQFDLSRVNIVRTIGLGSRKYYADQNSIIPNLLFNESKEGMELYPLLIMNYFLILSDYSEPTWDNPISVLEFYDTMRFVFGQRYDAIENLFERAIQFLIQHRLLLRSADQSQEEVPGLSLTDIKQIENVYVSGAAIMLWKELGTSSALFQLFLDDIWFDENEDYFGDDGNDIEHCIKYLEVLYEKECQIYNMAGNISHCTEYVEVFGAVPVCRQLLNGLIASLETIKASRDSRTQIRAMVAEKTLQRANKLRDKLQEWENKRCKFM